MGIPKMYDLTGKRFDKFLVIKYDHSDKRGRYWLCKCDCGNTKVVNGSYLRQGGHFHSCGKCGGKVDLVGKEFGELTVTSFAYKKNGKNYWNCKCSCGNTCVRYTDQLTNKEYVHDCGSNVHKIKDLTGKRFGKLVVEKLAYTKDGIAYFTCRCDCGNIKDIAGYELTAGRRTSCGCGKYHDMTGERYGKLTVVCLDRMEDGISYWKCKCDCGNYTIVPNSNLLAGNTKSCGCINHLPHPEDLTGLRSGKLTVIKYVGDSKWLCKCDCGNMTIKNAWKLKNNVSHSCGCDDGSYEEDCVRKYIQSLGVNCYKDRILQAKVMQEIDMYIPQYNIGIEYNGSAFHASLNGVYDNKDKYYHRDKFLQAKKQGIHLISIFDIDWNDKVKAYLKDLFTTKQKIYARNCSIKSIDKSIANEFCDKYHLQGHTNLSSICYGLYYNDELLSVMTFGKRRLKKQLNGYYELHRYCVKSGYTIIGGANKLLKHFIQDFSPKNILSYSDNDYFDGSIYERLGFKYIKQTEPNYYWFRTLDEWYKREQCQVQKLKNKFPQYYQEAIDNNANNIENYIMVNCFKCKKVYRSGNTRWELTS